MTRIAAFFSGILLVVALIASAPYVFAYAPAVNVGFLRDLFRLHQHFTIEAKGPRIFVISGSNGLYGIDGALLERQTGRRVINYAVHAGIDLDMYTDRLRPYLGQGDIILAPLEHAFYRRDRITGYEQQQYLAWIQYEFNLLRPWESLKYNAAIPSEIYLWLASSYVLKSREDNGPGDRASVVRRWADQQESRHPADQKGFNLAMIDRYGVIYVDKLPSSLAETWYKERRPYPVWRFKNIPARTLNTFARLEGLARERGATVYYTWPTEILHARNLPGNKADMESRRAFAASFSAAGHAMICDPADVILPYGMFGDTHYHLNGLGATARTVALVKCLAELGLAKPLPPQVVARPATLDQFVALAGLRAERGAKGFAVEHAAVALAKVRAALDRAAAAGALPDFAEWRQIEPGSPAPFPDTSRVDLAPLSRLVSELSDDERRGRAWIRSDAHNYKLVVRDLEDCEIMRTVLPAILDPKSGDCAIGIWSAPAARW